MPRHAALACATGPRYDRPMKLTDWHAHSDLSYCADPAMTLEVFRAALDDPQSLLARQAITNHGFQAYFPSGIAWSWSFLDEPELLDQYRERGERRLLELHGRIRAVNDDRFLFGVEVELMADGRLTLTDAVRAKTDVVLGSVHVLPKAYGEPEEKDAIFDAFLRYTRDLLAARVDVLAHPFRWLHDLAPDIPRDLVKETVALVRRAGAAMELNACDKGMAVIAMIQESVAAGVPIALATDAHAPAEVGRLDKHIETIRRAGFDPRDVHFYQGRIPDPPAR